MIPEITGAILGLFILAGLWTPVAGALVGAVELWIVVAGGANIWMSLTLAVFGGTLAMIGPGAWSIDARLFGRKIHRKLITLTAHLARMRGLLRAETARLMTANAPQTLQRLRWCKKS